MSANLAMARSGAMIPTNLDWRISRPPTTARLAFHTNRLIRLTVLDDEADGTSSFAVGSLIEGGVMIAEGIRRCLLLLAYSVARFPFSAFLISGLYPVLLTILILTRCLHIPLACDKGKVDNDELRPVACWWVGYA